MLVESLSMKLEREIALELNVDPVNVCTVGSTLICGKGKDIDLLCLVPSNQCLIDTGFKRDGEIHYESPLHSWRRDGINIIAVHDRGFFLAEVAIAHGARVVREMNFDMSDRDDRVIFHTKVRNAVMVRMLATAMPYDDLLDI